MNALDDPKRLHHPTECEGKHEKARYCSVDCCTWAFSVLEGESRASFAAARYVKSRRSAADFDALEVALDEADLLDESYTQAPRPPAPSSLLTPMTDDPLDDAPPEVRERMLSVERANAAARELPPLVAGEMSIFRIIQTWRDEHAPLVTNDALRVLASRVAQLCADPIGSIVGDTIPLPPEVRAKTARDILRAAICADGSLFVGIRTNGFVVTTDGGEEIDPREAWGIFVADVIRHLVRAFENEGHDPEETLNVLMNVATCELAPDDEDDDEDKPPSSSSSSSSTAH